MAVPAARTVRAGSGLGLGLDWQTALATAMDGALEPLEGAQPDLVMMFASAMYGDSYPQMLAEAVRQSGARELVGCSASGVIGRAREVEDEPGLAVLALALPPASELDIMRVPGDGTLADSSAQSRMAPHGLLVLADPFTMDVAQLIARLEERYARVPIMGGLATSAPGWRHTFLFHGTDVVEDGALVIGLGGATTLRPVVSQGCEPIGQVWTVTDATGHVVKAIGGRPAYEVLVETVRALEPDKRERANGNLLVGLAMDEYRDEFRRGDFLIRNLMGVDPKSGSVGVAAHVNVGQTLQFQIRDAQAADEELRQMLGAVPGTDNQAALLFACNGRGAGLFGAPDHDARTVEDMLGPVPLAGLFCNGEIGPVGFRTFVHGFTASLALISAAE